MSRMKTPDSCLTLTSLQENYDNYDAQQPLRIYLKVQYIPLFCGPMFCWDTGSAKIHGNVAIVVKMVPEN